MSLAERSERTADEADELDVAPPRRTLRRLRRKRIRALVARLAAWAGSLATLGFMAGGFLALRNTIQAEFGRGDLVEAALMLLLGWGLFAALLQHPLVRTIGGSGVPPNPRGIDAGLLPLLAGWTPNRPLPRRLWNRHGPMSYALVGGLLAVALWRGGEVFHAFVGSIGMGFVTAAGQVAQFSRQTLLARLNQVVYPATALAMLVAGAFWPLEVAAAVLMPAALFIWNAATRRWFAAESPRMVGAVSLADADAFREAERLASGQFAALDVVPFTAESRQTSLHHLASSAAAAAYAAIAMLLVLRGGRTFDVPWLDGVLATASAVMVGFAYLSSGPRRIMLTERPWRRLLTDRWRRRYLLALLAAAFGATAAIALPRRPLPLVGGTAAAAFAVALLGRLLHAQPRLWQTVVAPRLASDVSEAAMQRRKLMAANESASDPSAESEPGDESRLVFSPVTGMTVEVRPSTEERLRQSAAAQAAADFAAPAVSAPAEPWYPLGSGPSGDRPVRIFGVRLRWLTRRRLTAAMLIVAIELAGPFIRRQPWQRPPGGFGWQTLRDLAAILVAFVAPPALVIVLGLIRRLNPPEATWTWLLQGGWTAARGERMPRLTLQPLWRAALAGFAVAAYAYWRLAPITALAPAGLAAVGVATFGLTTVATAYDERTAIGLLVRWLAPVLLAMGLIGVLLPDRRPLYVVAGVVVLLPVVFWRPLVRRILLDRMRRELEPPDPAKRRAELLAILGPPLDRLPLDRPQRQPWRLALRGLVSCLLLASILTVIVSMIFVGRRFDPGSIVLHFAAYAVAYIGYLMTLLARLRGDSSEAVDLGTAYWAAPIRLLALMLAATLALFLIGWTEGDPRVIWGCLTGYALLSVLLLIRLSDPGVEEIIGERDPERWQAERAALVRSSGH